MKTMTSSHETLASPQPRRGTNRFVFWTGRILLVLLALIAIAYVLVERFQSVPLNAPEGESPQTEAPSGVEPPAPDTD